MTVLNQVLAVWLAQSPTPVPMPSPVAVPEAVPGAEPSLELELLRAQIEFLQTANEQVNGNFEYFANLLNTFFTVFGTILTIVLAIGAFLGWQSVKEIRGAVEQQVRREVEQRIQRAVEASEHEIKRIVEREGLLLHTVKVTYLVPEGPLAPTPEFKLLQTRVTQMELMADLPPTLLKSHVVVLDLKQKGWDREGAPDAALQRAQDWVDRLLNELPEWSALVIYTPNSRSEVVRNLRNKAQDVTQEFIPANTRISLMQAVEGAAYVSYGLQQARGR